MFPLLWPQKSFLIYHVFIHRYYVNTKITIQLCILQKNKLVFSLAIITSEGKKLYFMAIQL